MCIVVVMQLRDISEVSEVGVIIIQQFRHLGPFTHPLSSSPLVDHDQTEAFSILKWRPVSGLSNDKLAPRFEF